jgi:type IX secretion system PorP/SprF family membrane protein
LRQALLNTVKWCLLLLLPGTYLIGQDIHYSQFNHTPLNINPGLTGIFNGDLRFAGNFRDQWRSVSVPYTTFTVAFDTKLYPKRSDKYFWGLGINFNYDLAGAVKLNLLHLTVSGSYTRILNQNNIVTAGVAIGGAQRSFKSSFATTEAQWTGLEYDQTLPIGESFNNESFLFADVSAGLNYRLQANERTKIDLGAGAFHLNTPLQTFDGATDADLPIRLSIYGLGSLKLANGLDLLLDGQYTFQGPHDEFVAGLGAKIYLNQNRGRELAIVVGANWRTSDAIIPKLEFHYKTWHLGLSYDINYSDFTVATNRRGGPELSISYRILKVKPLSTYKTCPIY